MTGHDRRSALKVLGSAALGALALPFASACTPAKRVLVIGDSLTVGAAGHHLGDDHPWTWIVSAETGRTTNEGIVAAAQQAIGTFDLVIVALGTNDYLDSKATYGVRIDHMMTALAATPRVIWVNVDTAEARLGLAAFGVNAALTAAPARHRTLSIGDWNGYLRTVDDAAALRSPDGIHYLPAGNTLRARWMEGLVSG